MGKEITQKQIAKWLCTTRQSIEYQLRSKGANYIIQCLRDCGHNVRYQIINKYTRFYELDTGA